MKKYSHLFAIAFLVLVAGFTGACFEDSQDPITVKIISEGTDATATIGGFLLADNNVPLPLATLYTNGNTHFTQVTLDNVDNIYISAVIDGSANATVSIIVYRRANNVDTKVKETSTTVVSGGSRTVTITYEYGEETSTDTKTDTASGSSS